MKTIAIDSLTRHGTAMNQAPQHASGDSCAVRNQGSPNRGGCKFDQLGAVIANKFGKPFRHRDDSNEAHGEGEQVGGGPPATNDAVAAEEQPIIARDDRMKSSARYDETALGTSPNSRSMTFTFAPGSQPLPPYTIRRGVGVGGFGEVYFAVSEAGKEVALKRIQRNLDVELRGVGHCLNLKHPNLVSLYDICRDADGGAWVVMEYVAESNLRDVLDQHPNGLAESEARRWFAGIASGVSHLHSAGLVHRDLKPGNVFDDLGIVKVGDYGLSKFISSSQRGGHTESVGTFHYMAPEIGRGEYGREIDVYALGIMLFELLTGRVPFDGESCHEIIVKHLTSLPKLDTVPSPYRETISRALEKDPQKRPATVAEMVAPLGLSPADAVAMPVLTTASVACESKTSSSTAEYEASSAMREPPADRSNASGAAASAIPTAELTNAIPVASAKGAHEEPLMRAVRSSVDDLRSWWKSLEQSPRARFWIGALIAFVLFINTHWLLPALSIMAAVYVPYYIIRQMVLHSSEQPSYAKAHRLAAQTNTSQRPKTRVQWRSEIRHGLRAKRNVVRLAELNASWIATSLIVLALSLAAGVIGLRSGEVTASAVAPYFWTGFLVWAGTLGILGLGKLWERDEGEGLPRRLVLAGIGVGMGLLAYAMNEFLMLPLTPGPSELLDDELPQALYREDGTLRAAGMMAHFAILLGAIRWWKSVDPLRRTRLSLWSVAVVCVAAWGVHQLVPVPQPWGILVAGGLAIATQMSAPWINPRLVHQTDRAARSRQPA